MTFSEIKSYIESEKNPTGATWEDDYLPIIGPSLKDIKLHMCDDVEGEEPYPCILAPNSDIIEPQGKGLYYIYSNEDMEIYQCNSRTEMYLFIERNY